MKLAGRRALVTGGARGIGRAIALRLAAEGARVAVGYLRAAAAAQAVATLAGRQALTVQMDITSPDSVARAVDEAATRLDGLDLVISNAGVLVRQSLLDTPEEVWQQLVDINLSGPYRVARAAAPHLPRGGSIIHVSSVNAWLPSRSAGAYAVSKAGVSMLTRQLAVELAPRGIRVNEVCPGIVETDLNRRDLANPEFRAARLARIPLGRSGEPEDIAGAVAFLASDDAAWITGESLYVDGGTRWG